MVPNALLCSTRAPPLRKIRRAEVLLHVREEAVIGARGRDAGKNAALVLIIVAEYQRAAAVGERALIAGDFSFREIERIVVAAEVGEGLNQREAGRDHRWRSIGIHQRNEIGARRRPGNVLHQGRERLLAVMASLSL